MQPGDGTRVRVEEVLAHAGHIDAVGDAVGAAGQAGGIVRVDAGAYGRLCTMVPVLLGLLQGIVIDAMASAEQSLHDTGDWLRQAGRVLKFTDAVNAADLNRPGGPLR